MHTSDLSKHLAANSCTAWKPTVQVPSNHYNSDYYGWHRWVNYYWQLKTALETNQQSLLEIGIGGSILADALRRFGISVVTADIDPELNPDVVSSVTALPFGNAKFDTVVCCEVLEHMPYPHALYALKELRRVARQNVLISVPHVGPTFAISLAVHLLPVREFRIRFPHPKKLRTGGEHFWECGRPGFPLRRFRKDLLKAGFGLISEKRPPTSCWHAVFWLSVE